MRTKIIIGAGFVGILAVCAGFFMLNKPSERTVKGAADYSLAAVQLFNEFNENERNANAKYLNKVVAVHGTIAEISAVDSVGITVLLETENPHFGVSCQLPGRNPDPGLQRGQSIEIKGLCTGKLMDVVLIKCVIQSKTKS